VEVLQMIDIRAEDLLLYLTVYGGVVITACWLTMIIWAYRDMRARSRDTLAQLLAALVVAVLNVPGLLIYIFLRPRETLAEAYERSLEEEALLQEIEEKPTCPACGQRVREDWQACPHCHTRLKKTCVHCNRTLELAWKLCPYCARSQLAHEAVDEYAPKPDTVSTWRTHVGYERQPVPQQGGETLEFIEGDEYQ
jgi:RNA polymerase subunit RPABC4/transcription elongation factor Spt4